MDSIDDLVASEHHAGPPGEGVKDVEFRLGQRHGLAVNQHFPAGRIDLHGDPHGRAARAGARAADAWSGGPARPALAQLRRRGLEI